MNNSIEQNGFRAFLVLARPFTLLAPAVGFLAGSAMATGGEIPTAGLVGTLAVTILNAGSNIINQCCDLEIDRINKPTRPLPSGSVSMRGAALLGTACYIIALGLAYLVHPRLLGIFAVGALITLAYSAPPLRLKRHALSSSLALGFGRGCLLPVGGWAAVEPIWHSAPWFVGLIFGLYVFGASNTKDFADVKGDRAFGMKTLPVLLGPRRAAWMILPFLVLPFALIPLGAMWEWVPLSAQWLGFLALWGGYVGWLMLKRPEALTFESNHISWKHMYLLLMAGHVGFVYVFAIG